MLSAVVHTVQAGELWLGDRVRRLLDRAGIEKTGGCHLFRHAMATHMLDNGADVRHIQALLGHSQLSTTQIYTQVSVRKLQHVHAQTHPTAQLPTGESNARNTDE